MPSSKLLHKVARKGSDKEAIAAQAASDPSQIAALLDGLNSEKPEIKFGCSKVLRFVSGKDPAALYPHMDFFISLLGHKNTFLRLDAARIVANLAAVDSESKFEPVFDRFFAPIPGPTMIPAATVIAAGAEIARARPELAGRIASEILKVESAKYATTECRNVALGHAINSFDAFFDLIQDKAPVERLVKKQLGNTRPATRKKAERFLRRHGI